MLAMLLVQAALIALNAVFACAEIAVLSVNDTKINNLAAKGNASAQRVQGFLKSPEKFLATIQVAITLSGFLGSAFAAENFASTLTSWLLGLGVPIPAGTLHTISVIVITLILSYFTLVFGELVPKRVAMRKSESLSLNMSGFLKFIAVLFRPVVWLLSVSTNGILRLLGIDPNANEEVVDEEEIRMMIDSGRIEKREKELLVNVFNFDDVTAGQLCTHRMDVDFLSLTETTDQWEKIIHDTRHSFYPVTNGQDDEVMGILNAKDFFRYEEDSREIILHKCIAAPYFVPENMKADVLFAKMKQQHTQMAVVLDEYGGVEGVITLMDLVEALVGDIENDEFIEKIGPDTWKVTGNLALDKIENELDLDLGDDTETITGLVSSELGRVLEPGEDVTIDLGNVIIHVEEVADHTISKASLKKIKK